MSKGSKKIKTITVLNEQTRIIQDDYISLTDMLRSKDGDFFISDWLRNRNTVEYLGIWERIHNSGVELVANCDWFKSANNWRSQSVMSNGWSVSYES